MIRGRRPATGGDTGLLTDFNYDEIMKVNNWIKKNIIRSDKILWGKTSYGIKHDLENDIHLYMTNNQFKDAMLLAGYEPVDPNAKNWEYRIKLVYEINNNTSPFIEWLDHIKENIEDEWEKKFAYDAINDNEFPIFANTDIVLNYLKDISACDECIKAGESLLSRYFFFFR